MKELKRIVKLQLMWIVYSLKRDHGYRLKGYLYKQAIQYDPNYIFRSLYTSVYIEKGLKRYMPDH